MFNKKVGTEALNLCIILVSAQLQDDCGIFCHLFSNFRLTQLVPTYTPLIKVAVISVQNKF